MKVSLVIQGSGPWYQLRKGVPTCSDFDRILTPKTLKPSSSQEAYIYELIGDALRLTPPMAAERYASHAMVSGTEAEPEARAWYEMDVGKKVQQIGFWMTDNGRYGGSPDGLIVGTQADAAYIGHCGQTGELLDVSKLSERGGLELKNPLPKTHVRYLLEGGLPMDYRCQVHGHLAISGFDYWDFLSYCPGFPALRVRVEPDAFTLQLKGELDRFYDKYLLALEKIRGVALPPAEAKPIL